MRSRMFEYNRELNKLGKPIDREEWGMTPQTVNAYYNPLESRPTPGRSVRDRCQG